MSNSRFPRTWSVLAATAALVGSAALSGCGMLPSFLSESSPAGAPAESSASDRGSDPETQQEFFDNTMLMIPMVTSFDPTSSWTSIEPLDWDAADPSVRETVLGMGMDACARADAAVGQEGLEDPAMTWLAARFLCPEHLEAADEFLSNDATISPTHSMADLFELALVQEDATTEEIFTADRGCIGALALAWEVHEGFTSDATCWLIRVQSVEETSGNTEYVMFFVDQGDVENAATDARFAELAEASGATPNQLSELLDGME